MKYDDIDDNGMLGQLLVAAVSMIAEKYDDATREEILEKVNLRRQEMGYFTREEQIIRSVSTTFGSDFYEDSDGIHWCPPTCMQPSQK